MIRYVLATVLALLAALLVFVCLLAGAQVVGADASPSPSPSVSPSPSASPASPELVAWALKWHKIAVREIRPYRRARACMGLEPPKPLEARPDPSASQEEWYSAGRSWKHRAKHDDRAVKKLVRRMKHPGGSGCARWWPLARWAGWPKYTKSTLLYIINRESGGNPRAVNPSSGCAGLLQIHPCHHVHNVFDPLVNLRAGLRLYRASGWQPWSL